MKIQQLFIHKAGQEKGFFRVKSFLVPLFQKCIKKLKCQPKKFGIWFFVFSFMYLASVYPDQGFVLLTNKIRLPRGRTNSRGHRRQENWI